AFLVQPRAGLRVVPRRSGEARVLRDIHDAILALSNQLWQRRTQLRKYLAGMNSGFPGAGSCRFFVALFINRNG
ncbi:MAG: hypothetical protein Q7R45_14685, partial [Sulfuricaulis sp.]|nr:hypothetical protein [Sulfuricaulis sp.]